MAVLLQTLAADYTGLSSDTKPATPVTGATFYETDTGLTFIYSGSAWVEGRA